MKLFESNRKLTESDISKGSIQKMLDKHTFGTATATRDKNHKNFFTVTFFPSRTTGSISALGKETMLGQDARNSEKSALKLAQELEKMFKKELDLEDIGVETRNNTVTLFAVSDEFSKPEWNLNLKNKL
jgi:hypothetical protein